MNKILRGAPTAAEVDVEQLVLGLLLEDAETAWFVLDRIEPEDFTEGLHQRIAQTVRRVLDGGSQPRPQIVMAAMAGDKGLAEVGGADYFRLLTSKGRNRDIAAELCASFSDQAQRRALAAEIAATEERLHDNALAAGDILGEHQAAIQALAEGRARPDDPVSWYEAGEAVMARVEEPHRRSLLPFGIPALDNELGGMGDGDLAIIAGRPAMGKTALAISIGHAIARPKEQIRLDLAETRQPAASCGVFMTSLEMKHDALLERGLSMRAYARGARIPYQNVRLNRIRTGEQDVLARTLTEDSNLPFMIDHRRSQTVAQIGVRLRRAQAKFKRQNIRLGVGIIDHLGLIEPDGDYRGNKVAEVTQITKGLKTLAGVLGIPIIALCQLSRKVEEREDKRPYLSDLRESGSIEQDADQVLLLYRAEYYLLKSEPEEMPGDEKGLKRRAVWAAALERSRGKLEIHAAKNRHGAEARVTVNCDLRYNWIGEAA